MVLGIAMYVERFSRFHGIKHYWGCKIRMILIVTYMCSLRARMSVHYTLSSFKAYFGFPIC